MKFEVGKAYEVRLGAKHRGSLIRAKYVEKYEDIENCHVIEMISPISWRGNKSTLLLQKELLWKHGTGIYFMVDTKQILKEVK